VIARFVAPTLVEVVERKILFKRNAALLRNTPFSSTCAKSRRRYPRDGQKLSRCELPQPQSQADSIAFFRPALCKKKRDQHLMLRCNDCQNLICWRGNQRKQNNVRSLGDARNERQHVMSSKITASVLTAGLAIASVAISLPLTSVAHAQGARAAAWQATQCRVVGAISHRCYAFHSDATWREGLADYHGGNGG